MRQRLQSPTLVTTSLIFLALYVAPVYCADAELKQNPFWESVQPDVDVSGMVVVGLTSSGLVSGRDLSGIHVRPPDALAGHDVCLTVQSRDGVYLARNTYVLPEKIDGEQVRLPYDQSSELDLLRKYPARHLGISIVEGDCAHPGERLIRPHGPAKASEAGLGLMINGLNATDVFYSVPAANLSGSCDALRDGRTTVFNFWCRIPEPAQSTARELKIRIYRERYGRELAPATLTLAADSSST